MKIFTISSREFNQDTGKAKRASSKGPVFITDRGKAAHVLLSIEEYQRLVGGHRKIADVLGMAALADLPFEPPRIQSGLRPVDFT